MKGDKNMVYDEKITELEKKTSAMCLTVEDNLKRAFAYYENEIKPEEFKPIDDDTVDAFERGLEEECLDALVREHLYAGAMREVAGTLKVVEDIERIGDHAEDVAEWSGKIKKVGGWPIVKIQTMARIALEMVDSAFLALSRHDEGMALQVEKEDDLQDQLYDETIEELIRLDKEKDANHASILYSAILAKYLERISDHAVNVGEWVVFVNKGYHKDKQIF
jgi:phosphate transport system protein